MFKITRDSTFSVTHITYRGINGKIHHPHDDYKFAFYIYLHLNQFKTQSLAESLWLEPDENGYYSYMSHDYIANLSFHGGCTYYSKSLACEDSRIIELGCDYNHYYDENSYCDLHVVRHDLCRCIDSVHAVSEYLLFEHSKGALIEEKDAIYTKGGCVYPKAYVIEKGWTHMLEGEKLEQTTAAN